MGPSQVQPLLESSSVSVLRDLLRARLVLNKSSSRGCAAGRVGRVAKATHATRGSSPARQRAPSPDSFFPFFLSSFLTPPTPPPWPASSPAQTPIGFSPENNKPRSLGPVQSSEGKLRSGWQAVQLSFEANRW